jgi:hypothetical protein
MQTLVYRDVAGTSSAHLTQTINNGSSTAVGFDLYGKFSFWRFTGWGSYSYVHFDTTGLVPGISAHNFRLGVSYAVLKNLFATMSVMVRSTPEGLVDDPQPGYSTGSVNATLRQAIQNPWQLNAHILYSPFKYLDVYADLQNFTNHKSALTGAFLNAYMQNTFQGLLGVKFNY